MNEPSPAGSPLKIVVFSILPFAFTGISRWAEMRGHSIPLLVTSPGPASRRNTSYQQTIASLPPRQEVVVSTRMKSLGPYIASLDPDLILSFTFPYLIPPELVQIPKHGAVNIHPTPLPKYRGPNPLRLFYEGESEFGATLHWIAPEFDTGNILSQVVRTAPEEASFQELFGQLGQLVVGMLDEGIAKAVAGDPGEPQNHDEATYGARFGPGDLVLNLSKPAWVLKRQISTLQVAGQQPHIEIDGAFYPILGIEPVLATGHHAAGDVINRDASSATIQSGDSVVRFELGDGAGSWPELRESPV